MQLCHAQRYCEQDRAQRGERNVSGQRRGQKHDSKKHERVDDRGDRGARAGANVRGRPRDRSRGRDPTCDRAKSICDALGHQLLVGIVARIGHAVRDHGGEQRFNCAERGDGESRSHQVAHRFERDSWKMKAGQTRGNATKARLDCRDWPTGEVSYHGCDYYRHDASWHAPSYERQGI